MNLHWLLKLLKKDKEKLFADVGACTSIFNSTVKLPENETINRN